MKRYIDISNRGLAVAALSAVLVALCGCVNTHGIECGSGYCPPGYECSENGQCFLSAQCGNGVKEGEEACDDGNVYAMDSCSSTCQVNLHVTAGGDHTCALLDTGVVRCWGSGVEGQLGYGNRKDIGDDESPASAGDVDIGGSVVQLSAGGDHTCALLSAGAVRCWGRGSLGRLGYGNSNDIGATKTPASAGDVNVGGSVAQLAAGHYHTCALLDTGAVRCWGYGFFGQLGYGNTENIGDNEVPASAGNVHVGGSIVQLAAGRYHTCALLDTGAVRCWGRGSLGQMGYGDTEDIGDDEAPASAGDVDIGGLVVQLAAGGDHTCALLNTGAVRCWGYGFFGQLGYGDTEDIGDDETPASAGDVDVGGSVVQLAAGGDHTCALLDTGDVRCWGRGSLGRLGYGDTEDIGDDETPASAGNVDVGRPVVQITAGGFHTCATLTGAIRCWGSGADGQLGYGNTDDIGHDHSSAITADVHVSGLVLDIAAGRFYTCALLDTGAVRCWGSGFEGQLGYGNTEYIGDNETPASAGDVDVGGSVMQLAAGGDHVCTLLDSGAVRCWGSGADGQLGYGNTESIGDDESPASVGDVEVGGSINKITAGSLHTCALLDTGAVRCWGSGADGQLGYGNTESIGDDETPTSAGDVDVGGVVVQLAAGSGHTCALLDTGAVRCWGSGADGQLGYGNTESIGDDETPASAGDVDVGGVVVQLAAGGDHTCALLDTGVVRCWGSGVDGQLGYGNTDNIGDDETLAGVRDVEVGDWVVQLASGDSHTCALVLDTGAVRCWGFACYGQLGYGNTERIGDNETPASAGDVEVGRSIVKLTAGDSHTCALVDTGDVRCWGFGRYGQLGYGNDEDVGDNETPAIAGDVHIEPGLTRIPITQMIINNY